MKRMLLATGIAAALFLPNALGQTNGIGIFKSILGQPSTAGTLGKLLPGSASQAAQPVPPATGDLFTLLAQSRGEIDEAKEVEIGRQLAAVLLGGKPLLADMPLQRYVNRLGRWIGLQSPRPQLPWTFAVLDDPGFNAFAAPGGIIFVTKGLIDRVDEAELAGILAHEITHVTERHHLNALRAKTRSGQALQLLGSQIRTGSTVGSMVSQQLLALGRNLYASGLDQVDEFDADRQGVALAARAGFDPFGLPGVLEQLRTQAPDDALFALTLSTHPPAQQRLDSLEQSMGHTLDELAGKPPVQIAQRLAQKR